ncbi:MAG: hypothetical protein GF341_05770 [candidate division Zixibacteria bacterium]|nr:hypothetical protein [candidate division Zixibacteria bacterium]
MIREGYLDQEPRAAAIMGTEEAKKHRNEMVTGLILFGLGIIFLLNSFDIVDIGESWPLILVVVGLSLIAGSLRRDAAGRSPQS